MLVQKICSLYVQVGNVGIGGKRRPIGCKWISVNPGHHGDALFDIAARPQSSLPAARCAEATSQAGMAWRVPFSAEKLRHADHPMMVDDQARMLLSINRISKFGIACSRIGLDAGQMIRDLHPRQLHSPISVCERPEFFPDGRKIRSSHKARRQALHPSS
jgi:hypothetical protein